MREQLRLGLQEVNRCIQHQQQENAMEIQELRHQHQRQLVELSSTIDDLRAALLKSERQLQRQV